MEIKDYLSMARRWAWLLVLGFALGGMTGGVITVFQTPVYQSSTRILILRAPQEKNTDYTYLSDQQLVQTYIQLLSTQPVLQAASGQLGYLVRGNQINISQISDSQTIRVTVEDGDPQRAAAIANALVQILIDQNEKIQSSRYSSTEQSIQAQISQVEAQIASLGTQIDSISAETVVQQQQQVEAQISALQNEVNQLQAEIASLTPPSSTTQQVQLSEKESRLNQVQSLLGLYQQIYTDLVVLGKPVTSEGDTTSQLSQLQTTLGLYQQIYINLLNNLEAVRLARLQNTPNVVQIEAAAVPSKPIRPQPVANVGFGIVIGLMLAGGIAFLIEYIDDTIRTPEDVERILGLPVIGYIGDMNDGSAEFEEIHVVKRPRSPIAEAFRSLRTNLEFTNVDKSLNTILITSSGPAEGKTTVSSNLAAIIAQSGRRVLIIDADMRRPRLHSVFGVSNRVGLSALFRGDTSVRSVMQEAPGIPGVWVITSGVLPPNPTELLASAKMDLILIEARRDVDVIIVDSPPALVADFQVLATKLDGVLLVIQPGQTRADNAIAMLEQLNRVNARTLGIVFNKIPHDSYYYGGYNYYYPYKRGGNYYISEENQPQMQQMAPVLYTPPMLPPQTRPEPAHPLQQNFQPEQPAPLRQQPEPAYVVQTPQPAPASQNIRTQPRRRAARPSPPEMEYMQVIEILQSGIEFTVSDEDSQDDFFEGRAGR